MLRNNQINTKIKYATDEQAHKRYYQNREQIRQQQKEYYYKNKEIINEYKRLQNKPVLEIVDSLNPANIDLRQIDELMRSEMIVTSTKC